MQIFGLNLGAWKCEIQSTTRKSWVRFVPYELYRKIHELTRGRDRHAMFMVDNFVPLVREISDAESVVDPG